MVERAAQREAVTVRREVPNVYVGCNLPNGLELQLYEMKDSREMTPQGPNTVQKAFKTGKPVTLRGAARRFGAELEYTITSGYAVTLVPKDFWEKWCEQNADSALLENRGLIAGADLTEVQAKAAECKQDKIKSGLEPINPLKPPAVGGGLKVTPATAV